MGFGSGGARRRRVPQDPGVDDAPMADPMEVAREIALRRLSLRPHSRAELSDQLRSRNVPDEVVHELLERYEEVGLVDDAQFAGQWAASRQSNKLLSRSAVRRELQAKGVDRDTIDEATAGIDHEAELAAARTLAQRKWRQVSGLPRETAYRRLAGMLARKGYGGGVVNQVVREVLDVQIDHEGMPLD